MVFRHRSVDEAGAWRTQLLFSSPLTQWRANTPRGAGMPWKWLLGQTNILSYSGAPAPVRNIPS